MEPIKISGKFIFIKPLVPRRIIRITSLLFCLSTTIITSCVYAQSNSVKAIRLVPLYAQYDYAVATDIPAPEAGEPYHYQASRLYKAYFTESEDELNLFLDTWKKQFPVLTDNDLANYPEVVRHAFVVVEVFYEASNLRKVDATIVNEELLSTEYLLLQDSLTVSVYDNLPEANELFTSGGKQLYSLTLPNFSPETSLNTPHLTLSREYIILLNNFFFLGIDDEDISAETNLPIDSIGMEYQQRRSFLEDFFPYVQRRDTVDINLPHITDIHFNSGYTEAHVKYWYRYGGGTTRFMLNNGQWSFESSRSEWIE